MQGNLKKQECGICDSIGCYKPRKLSLLAKWRRNRIMLDTAVLSHPSALTAVLGRVYLEAYMRSKWFLELLEMSSLSLHAASWKNWGYTDITEGSLGIVSAARKRSLSSTFRFSFCFLGCLWICLWTTTVFGVEICIISLPLQSFYCWAFKIKNFVVLLLHKVAGLEW